MWTSPSSLSPSSSPFTVYDVSDSCLAFSKTRSPFPPFTPSILLLIPYDSHGNILSPYAFDFQNTTHALWYYCTKELNPAPPVTCDTPKRGSKFDTRPDDL